MASDLAITEQQPSQPTIELADNCVSRQLSQFESFIRDMHRYSITVFISALLLFQVQPLIAKVILPWFGGTAAVWTTCMMFFQIALLLGYLYSHGLRILLSPRSSWILHSVVMLLALLMLPVLPGESLKPGDYASLSFAIISVLTLSVGIPFFVLSTTGPLIQAWQSVSHQGNGSDTPASSPYRLYALSNVGSLLALVTYPFFIEPNLRLDQQSVVWSVLFVTFVVSCILSGWQVRKSTSWATEDEMDGALESGGVSVGRMALWLLLAMLPSIILLSTTNLMCQEIASVPFLWIVPLALYLISFIICFEKPGWYRRRIFAPLLIVGSLGGLMTMHISVYTSASLQVAILALSSFACGMTCHGELERLKPHASRLTLFYLFVSLGGCLGGIFVVLVAPRIFVGFLEFHVALLGTLLLGCAIPVAAAPRKTMGHYAFVMGTFIVGGAVLGSFMHAIDATNQPSVLFKGRNEYGTFSVKDYGDLRMFVSGNIDHGTQLLDESRKFEPHGYYSEGSGFAVCVESLRKSKDRNAEDKAGLKVGVIGLGIGSMLGWAEPQDQFVFYEINPAVEKIACQWFSFLEKFNDQTEVVIGDGRIRLERELRNGKNRDFDLLAIDAFSSDSIPVHLLTRECFDVYLQQVNQDGIILFHISNRFIDLRPVLFEEARARGLFAVYVVNKESSDWVLVSRRDLSQDELILANARSYELPKDAKSWTDDYASLWSLIDWTPGVEVKQMINNSVFASDKKESPKSESDDSSEKSEAEKPKVESRE